jgi:integrase
MKKAEAMQRLSECMRLQRLSRNTIKVYSEWLDRYINFLAGSHAETIEEKMGQFLTRIVTQDKVSASTQKQALCAIIYFYKRVLGMEIGDISFLRSKRPVRLPEVFSRQEVWRVLDRLDGEGWLWGALMYGCGLRLEECCSLRIKDVDIDRRLITVRQGKGNKDRVVPLPELLVEPLQKQIRNMEHLHASYSASRVPVSLPDRLDKKYPQAPLFLGMVLAVSGCRTLQRPEMGRVPVPRTQYRSAKAHPPGCVGCQNIQKSRVPYLQTLICNPLAGKCRGQPRNSPEAVAGTAGTQRRQNHHGLPAPAAKAR